MVSVTIEKYWYKNEHNEGFICDLFLAVGRMVLMMMAEFAALLSSFSYGQSSWYKSLYFVVR